MSCLCVKRQEIDKLQKEQEELHRNLGVCKSSSRQQQDSEDAQSLRALLEQRDTVEEELRREMQCQKELEKEVNQLIFSIFDTNSSLFLWLLIFLVTQTTVFVVSVIVRSQTWSWSWQSWEKGRSVLVIHKGLRHDGLRRPYTRWNTNLTEWVIKLFITKYIETRSGFFRSGLFILADVIFGTFLIHRQTLYAVSSPGPYSLQWAADQKQPTERGVADSSYWACPFPAATQQAWKGQRSHNWWFKKQDNNRPIIQVFTLVFCCQVKHMSLFCFLCVVGAARGQKEDWGNYQPVYCCLRCKVRCDIVV